MKEMQASVEELHRRVGRGVGMAAPARRLARLAAKLSPGADRRELEQLALRLVASRDGRHELNAVLDVCVRCHRAAKATGVLPRIEALRIKDMTRKPIARQGRKGPE